jgi:hypothetical protein
MKGYRKILIAVNSSKEVLVKGLQLHQMKNAGSQL